MGNDPNTDYIIVSLNRRSVSCRKIYEYTISNHSIDNLGKRKAGDELTDFVVH